MPIDLLRGRARQAVALTDRPITVIQTPKYGEDSETSKTQHRH